MTMSEILSWIHKAPAVNSRNPYHKPELKKYLHQQNQDFNGKIQYATLHKRKTRLLSSGRETKVDGVGPWVGQLINPFSSY